MWHPHVDISAWMLNWRYCTALQSLHFLHIQAWYICSWVQLSQGLRQSGEPTITNSEETSWNQSESLWASSLWNCMNFMVLPSCEPKTKKKFLTILFISKTLNSRPLNVSNPIRSVLLLASWFVAACWTPLLSLHVFIWGGRWRQSSQRLSSSQSCAGEKSNDAGTK